VIRKGQAPKQGRDPVSRIATIGLGMLAIILGILFEKQNIAFMVGLAFGVAAAANFPVLILSMYWKGLTTRGALWGGYGGVISAVLVVALLEVGVGGRAGQQGAAVPLHAAGAVRHADRLHLRLHLLEELDSSARAKLGNRRVRRPVRARPDRLSALPAPATERFAFTQEPWRSNSPPGFFCAWQSDAGPLSGSRTAVTKNTRETRHSS
jgi:hypothetical protein